jgi:hypothetical protein
LSTVVTESKALEGVSTISLKTSSKETDVLRQFDSSLLNTQYDSILSDVLLSHQTTEALMDIGGIAAKATTYSMISVWTHGYCLLVDTTMQKIFSRCRSLPESLCVPWPMRSLSLKRTDMPGTYAFSDAILYISAHRARVTVISCWTNTCVAPLSTPGVEKLIIDSVKQSIPDGGFVYLIFPIRFPAFRQRQRGVFRANPGIVIVWNSDTAAASEIASILEECVISNSTLVLVSDIDSLSCVALMCRDSCILSTRVHDRSTKLFLPDKFSRENRLISIRYMLPTFKSVSCSKIYEDKTIEEITSL